MGQEGFGVDRRTGLRHQRDRAHRAGLHRAAVGSGGKVHADPDGKIADAASAAGAFQQDACQLAAVQQNVIGPLQREGLGPCGQVHAGVEQGQRGHEAAQCGALGALLRFQDEGGGQVALGVDPCPAPATARGGLFMGQDPDRPGKRGRDPRGLVQGRVHALENMQSIASGPVGHVHLLSKETSAGGITPPAGTTNLSAGESQPPRLPPLPRRTC